ncbi:uncharacterized protein FYW23_008935 [Sylvia borin]
MEALAKVVSLMGVHWGIKCDQKLLQLVITSLLDLGAIQRPVDILKLERWETYTAALAEDTKASGSGKILKAWGKVEKALRKAIEEQETWNAAKTCLFAATQPKGGSYGTAGPPGEREVGGGSMRGRGAVHPSRSPSPKPPEPTGDPQNPPAGPPNPKTPAESPEKIAVFPTVSPNRSGPREADASPPPSPAAPSQSARDRAHPPQPAEEIAASPTAEPVQRAEERARFFWGGLAREARGAEKASAGAQTETPAALPPPPPPPPYGQDGDSEAERGRADRPHGAENPEVRTPARARAREASKSPEFPVSTAHARESEGGRRRDRKPLPALPNKGETPPWGGPGEPRGWEWDRPREAGRRHPREKGRGRTREAERGRTRGEDRTHPRKAGRGRSPRKRHSKPEVYHQSTSDSEGSSTSAASLIESSETGTDSETETTEFMRFLPKPSKAFNNVREQTQCKLTDWGKIKVACAEWEPAAAVHAFPVRVTGTRQNPRRIYTPLNTKEVQTVIKAVQEKGINSAVVSTLVDGLFGNDDMLPFDISQITRMLFDGAGLIIFQQEWSDLCTTALAQTSGQGQPLHGSTLSRLLGKHDDVATPQDQATRLSAEEVKATTRAAREAIRAASRVVDKATPWSTIKQGESEGFTHFVDRLQAAIDSSTLPAAARGPVVMDCLKQQCNTVTKDILRSLPAGASLADMIKHVDMLIGRPRNAYMPLPEDGDTPPNRQTAPEKPTRVRPMHQRYVCVILLLGLVARGQASPDYYPHQPFRWVMRHLTSDKVLRDITTPNTPSFVLRITDLFPGQPKVDPYSPHSSHMYLSYWCPASNAGKSYCNYPGWGYCGYWGCETIVTDARPSGPGWDPREPDKFLQFTWAPAGCKTPLFVHGNSYRNSYKIPKFRKCTYYNMTVLQPNHPSWAVGKAWTVVLHGSKEWVNVRIIRLQPSASRAVGPNKIIKSTQTRRNTTYPKILPTSVTKIPTSDAKAFQIDRLTRSDPDPILRMLEATFLSLNESNPNLTNSCWLCYDVQPPFYEGVALNTPFSYSTADAPHQCRWDTPRRGITLNQVTGRGKCFGNATLAKRKGNVCTKVEKPSRKNNKWAVPSESAMWVCQRSGVSPCVFLPKFNDSNDFCVQVLIVPRVLYHSDEEVYNLFEESGRLHKREIMTSITIAMLLSLGAAGTATGVSALATQHQGLSQLQMTIDEDLQRIEKSISYLEKSVSSLSEVVLQNRRGLDLLFMQQGGLCAALKEECCFYADHTGVVRDSMAELRNRLAQRQKDREAQQGWFESWFNQSPWLTTLISTLVGPLVMLLLAVTFGPCLLNKIVSFVKARLEQTNILFIGQHEML